MLAARSLPATFYVPLSNDEGRDVINAADLRHLRSQGFEIGAHTVSHRALPGLSNQELFYEVLGSKSILEDQLGDGVRMFCYPRGRYDKRILKCVERCGFRGARTTRMLALGPEFNRFEVPTSLQAYPHPPVNYFKNLGRHRDLGGLNRFVTDYMGCDTWLDLGKRLFERVMEHGGIWHLYGHSWEVEEFGLWRQLEELLDYVSHRSGVTYVSNSGIPGLAGQTVSEGARVA